MRIKIAKIYGNQLHRWADETQRLRGRSVQRVALVACTLMLAQTTKAADSIYVCKNGVYENRLLADGLEIKAVDYDCDSIVFVRPAPQVQVDFTDYAQSHKVDAVFIKSIGEQRLVTNTTMKPYAASSSSASDVLKIDVEAGVTKVLAPLNILTNVSKGITITLLYDDDHYLSKDEPDAIKTRQNTFLHRYTFTSDGARAGNWMATLPSKVRFNMLTLPGAHNAATSMVTTDVAKTQSLTINEQLLAGVRAFDLRPRYNASSEADIQLEDLEIYHGIVATGVKWRDAMDTILQFLKENPTETVFVNLQKENTTGTDYSSTWRTSMRTYLSNHKSQVLQQLTTTTTLSDCRGKVVVVSHNPYGSEGNYYDTVYGGLTANWGDNETFTTTINYINGSAVCPATISDNYNATNTAMKQGYIKANLDAANMDNSTKWYYTFINVAWSFLGSTPSGYAKTHNSYVYDLLQSDTYTSRLGFIFYDYCGDINHTKELLPALISQNYKYLY